MAVLYGMHLLSWVGFGAQWTVVHCVSCMMQFAHAQNLQTYMRTPPMCRAVLQTRLLQFCILWMNESWGDVQCAVNASHVISDCRYTMDSYGAFASAWMVGHLVHSWAEIWPDPLPLYFLLLVVSVLQIQ